MRDWLYPGAKVVCADDEGAPELRKGMIYTVTYVDPRGGRWRGDWVDCPGVLLREVAPSEGFGTFSALRFRPLRKRTTDISIFRQLLTPSKQKEGV